jgi:hypothetical protein
MVSGLLWQEATNGNCPVVRLVKKQIATLMIKQLYIGDNHILTQHTFCVIFAVIPKYKMLV